MSTGSRAKANRRGGWQGVRALFLGLAALAVLMGYSPRADAIKAIEIDAELERVDITGLGEAY